MDNQHFLQRCSSTGIIPVLVIEDATTAVPIAESLLAGGLSVIEVTLRTEAAWDAVEKIHKHVGEAVVGVGSVLQPSDLQRAADLGLSFCVSPGFTPTLLRKAQELSINYLPGVSTVSEMVFVREHGIRFMKFFPAELSGGTRFLRAVAGPVADITFCPTGGVTISNLTDYLGCPNVACVGGTWLVNRDEIAGGDYRTITRRAAEAVKIVAEQRL